MVCEPLLARTKQSSKDSGKSEQLKKHKMEAELGKEEKIELVANKRRTKRILHRKELDTKEPNMKKLNMKEEQAEMLRKEFNVKHVVNTADKSQYPSGLAKICAKARPSVCLECIAGDFTGDYARDFTGNYSRDFAGNYSRAFVGDYVGTTIQSSYSTVEAYTLYVRTA